MKELVQETSALHACGELRGGRLWAKSISFVLLLLLLSSFFVPWTQNVRGSGRVIAYLPQERETPIRAPMSGIVRKWQVREGQIVTKGQVIAEMQDNDPQRLSRLEQARAEVEDQAKALDSAVSIAEMQVRALTDAREAALTSARLQVNIALDALDGAQQKKIAADAKFSTAEVNLKRLTSLNKQDLVSDRELELAQLAATTSKAELDQAEASLRAARRKVSAARAYVQEIQQKNQASIEKAKGELEKMRVERRKTGVSALEADTDVARQRQMKILAPTNGRILSINAREGTEFVKSGTKLAMLVPETQNLAVEIWLDGNDGPLVTKGRKVRLQFEGWPALQFVGWPSTAIGTFGGVVDFVDPAARTDGKLRVVIRPDPKDDPWPSQRYLRQGVRAKGWVLLNQVSVAYEIWRQLNGFPPSLDKPAEDVKL